MADDIVKTQAEKQAEEAVDYAVEGNDLGGFVGVSHEYKTYSEDTAKPVVPEGKETDYKLAQRVESDKQVVFNKAGQDASREGTVFSSGPAVDENGDRIKAKPKVEAKTATTTKTAAAPKTTAAS